MTSVELRALRAVESMPKGYPLGINSRVCRGLTAAGYLRAKEVFNAPGHSTLHFFLTPTGERAVSNELQKERAE